MKYTKQVAEKYADNINKYLKDVNASLKDVIVSLENLNRHKWDDNHSKEMKNQMSNFISVCQHNLTELIDYYEYFKNKIKELEENI